MAEIGFSSALSCQPVNPHCCPDIRSCKHILYTKLVFTPAVIILKSYVICLQAFLNRCLYVRIVHET